MDAPTARSYGFSTEHFMTTSIVREAIGHTDQTTTRKAGTRNDVYRRPMATSDMMLEQKPINQAPSNLATGIEYQNASESDVHNRISNNIVFVWIA